MDEWPTWKLTLTKCTQFSTQKRKEVYVLRHVANIPRCILHHSGCWLMYNEQAQIHVSSARALKFLLRCYQNSYRLNLYDDLYQEWNRTCEIGLHTSHIILSQRSLPPMSRIASVCTKSSRSRGNPMWSLFLAPKCLTVGHPEMVLKGSLVSKKYKGHPCFIFMPCDVHLLTHYVWLCGHTYWSCLNAYFQ